MIRDVNVLVAERLGKRFYYGWVIAAVVFLGNLGAFSLNPAFGLFVTPLEQEFGWDRSTISRSLTLGTVLGAFMAPVLGVMIDRFGARRLTILFAMIALVGYGLMSRVNQPWQYNIAVAIVYAMLVTGVGQMMSSININRWFVRRRGRAMGLVMMGASGGSVFFVPLCTWLIAAVGWRQTYQVVGLITFLLIAIPAWLLLINRPEDLGLEGHRELGGSGAAASRGSPGEAPGGWGLREAARTRPFWILLVGIMLGSFAVQGYFIHAIPHMETLGFSRMLAASVWSSFFMTGVVSKFMWGFIVERVGVRRCLVFLWLAECVGMYLLWTAGSAQALFIYAVLNGLGHGPFLQLLAMVWAEYFGRQAISRIYGAVQPAIVVAGSLGPWVAGYIFDRTGHYDGFFKLAIAFCLIAAFLFWLVPSPGRLNHARQG